MSGRRRMNITASYCWMRTVTWRSSASELSYGRHTERASPGLCGLPFGAECERLSAGRVAGRSLPGFLALLLGLQVLLLLGAVVGHLGLGHHNRQAQSPENIPACRGH